MNTGGDAADQMVRESIQITESAAKLAGLGAKNLAALLLALAKDNQKSKGKTNLSRMLREGRELKVFRIKIPDLQNFHKEAKQYGVLYTTIRDKNNTDGLCDILARAEDVSKINRIIERMGYPIPIKENERKNADPRAPQGNRSKERGNGSMPTKERTTSEKASVRDSLDSYREAIRNQSGGEPKTLVKMPKAKGR